MVLGFMTCLEIKQGVSKCYNCNHMTSRKMNMCEMIFDLHVTYDSYVICVVLTWHDNGLASA